MEKKLTTTDMKITIPRFPSGRRCAPMQFVAVSSNWTGWQIGEWKSKDGLQIGDITWPGMEPSPPKGRPAKYHIRVVTLQEKPYVVYSDPDTASGTCPPQSVLCRMAPQNKTGQ